MIIWNKYLEKPTAINKQNKEPHKLLNSSRLSLRCYFDKNRGVGNPEIINAKNINNPPIALWVMKASPPNVQANKAAKTGSSEKINETLIGDLIFWARNCITNAIKVGKRPRKITIQRIFDDLIPRGKSRTSDEIKLKIPTTKNC